ncbi:hypothetical protein [Crocosphaera sp. XPORK-15E]|uniref:hypothetical protein n=1 Tax=Crocosphaera sp. XPORK-15E TaxID=3110247 RepID=UPI002B208AFB|nr:hypothetical protein [Crocosphaera sp. XPORK-15E]MEA5536609.1 hypothetical protein [Crocosphaera sp. XPORK-15E]
MLSTDDPNPSYLLFEHTQSLTSSAVEMLKEENDQSVEILSTNELGGNAQENEVTLSDEVTNSEPVSCNVDIIDNVAVSHSPLPALADSDEVVTEVIDWDDVVAAIDQLMERLGWDKERGKRHLILTYGVNSRRQLSDEQIFEFLAFLQSQSKFQAGQTAMFQGVRVVIERVINEVVAVVRSWDKPKERCFEVAMVHLT